MKRCPECFREYEEDIKICPHCGAPSDAEPEEPVHLIPGTTLMKRYFIGKSIGAGGFGIVYKAWDMKLETVVAVKEFFASRLVTRAAGETEIIVSDKSPKAYTEFSYRKERFLAEARTMAKFSNHRNIPNVFDFFEENKTAYIVMELLEGVPLNEYIKQKNGRIDIDFAVMIAGEIGNALKSLHSMNIIHRDVAPDNIFICTEKEIKIKLMDLGAAKLADATDDVIDIILKPGYSPPEQYIKGEVFGPWTDIYALGATLYNMITGVKPDESTNRTNGDSLVPPSDIIKNIPANLNNTIMKSMAVNKHMRFKNADEFLKALNGSRKVMTLSGEIKLKKLKRVLGICAAFGVIAASTFAGMKIYDHKTEEQQLKPADISIWYSVEENSGETAALESIKSNFTSVYPEVNIELKGIPADSYYEELRNAAEKGVLPDLFESTEADSSVLDKASDLSNVISSEQFKNCLFLNEQSCTRQIPLAIEIPVAFVITNGAEYIEYNSDFFKNLTDFNYDNIAADENYQELCKANFPDFSFNAGYSDFMDNETNKSAVMLSSTMKINDFRNTLTNYEKKCVFPDTDKIICNYTYKWSISSGSENDTTASERLLSWMLGSVYQNTLMISVCSDGQIPVNEECFRMKTESRTLSPVSEICSKFSFESEE